MTQSRLGTIDPDETSGDELADLLVPFEQALHTTHRGPTRPTYVQAGMIWIDDSATPWLVKLYTGVVDVPVLQVTPSTSELVLRDVILTQAAAPTKRARFDTSLVTAGQTRTITVPNRDISLDAGWEKIVDAPLSASGSLVQANLGAFRRLRMSGRVFPSISTKIVLQVSTDNAATWLSGASDYGTQIFAAQGASGPSSFVSGNAFQLSANGSVSPLPSNAAIFSLEIEPFGVAGANGRYKGQVSANDGSAEFIGALGGRDAASAARNAIRIINASGGTLTGNVLIEGVRA